MLVLFVAAPGLAHDEGHEHDSHPVVIDTDLGLDDAVALALALQSSYTDIAAVVFCEGAASRARGVRTLEGMLDWFNRRDVPLYDGVPSRAAAPPFRAFVETAVADAVADCRPAPFARAFAPDAYTSDRGTTIVLALGPLTNLAAALEAKPDIRRRIDRIIIAGEPNPERAWNLKFDRPAFEAVRTSGIALEFVIAGKTAVKPDWWESGAFRIGQGTSVGEAFLERLLSPQDVRRHYFEQFTRFHDELVPVFGVDRSIFGRHDIGGSALFAPLNSSTVNTRFTRLIDEGRQRKNRVVFADRRLPGTVLQSDVRERRDRIVAKNGENEWFAQLLMNELHEHLGAYSVIGVKMGLRAAELLNAPPHSMTIESHTPPDPPVSCLNDGLIVATGSTPGRGLFERVPAEEKGVRASFSYNGRTVVLTLKPEYRDRIRDRIADLRKHHSLEDRAYWLAVRDFGLDVWENWHRRDLFEIANPKQKP